VTRQNPGTLVFLLPCPFHPPRYGLEFHDGVHTVQTKIAVCMPHWGYAKSGPWESGKRVNTYEKTSPGKRVFVQAMHAPKGSTRYAGIGLYDDVEMQP